MRLRNKAIGCRVPGRSARLPQNQLAVASGTSLVYFLSTDCRRIADIQLINRGNYDAASSGEKF
jgi:hypothetical protein